MKKAAFLALFLLAACGFHPRGLTDLPVESLRVEGDYQLTNDIARAVEAGSRVHVVRDPKQPAEVIVRIIGVEQQVTPMAVGGAGRVRSLLLVYRLRYQVLTGDNTPLTGPQTIEQVRELTYSDNQVLAKESEQNLVFRDMRSDAVQQLLRRLAALGRAVKK